MLAAILATVQGEGGYSAQDGGSPGADVWCGQRRMGAHRELLDGSIGIGWGLAGSCWMVQRPAIEPYRRGAVELQSGSRLLPRCIAGPNP
jgi:hypothetical protein